MIHLNDSIRLTTRDTERWVKITGFAPGDIRTIGQLDAYVQRCKTYYWGTSKETRYLHWLIDHERAIQLGMVHDVMPPPWPPRPTIAPRLVEPQQRC